MTDGMTKADRAELAKLWKAKIRVAKAGVEQRKAEQLAHAEAQLAARYEFDDAAWADVTAVAKQAVEEADAAIAERCEKLGIPERFRPEIRLAWYGRGENAIAERRAELRKVAQTHIEADIRQAKHVLAATEVEGLTQLAVGGLESDEAREFLASMPTPEALMPPLDMMELEQEYDREKERGRARYGY